MTDRRFEGADEVRAAVRREVRITHEILAEAFMTIRRFTAASNVYTTLAYFSHERVWDRIKWGRRIFTRSDDGVGAATTPLEDH
jgi:uncharacterized membrane protein